MVAAAASWMEAFHLPLREVEAKYTKSEMGLLAWRSGEVASNMHVGSHSGVAGGAERSLELAGGGLQGEFDAIENALGSNIVDKISNTDGIGEMDMRKLTGNEMLRYLSTFGIYVGMGQLGKPAPKPGTIEAQVAHAYKDWGKK